MNMKTNIICGVALAAMTLASCAQPQQKEAEQTIEKKANVLVVVDVQRDFLDPAGSLYVAGGEVLPAKIAEIAPSYDAVIFTLDWHPGNHCSFAAQGGIWPSHCVAFTEGAGLADEFSLILAQGSDKVQLFLKGQEQDKEQYGAFEDLAEDTVIYQWLKNADHIDVCGIAGDYCVKESTANILKIADAAKVSMLTDCIASIDDGSTLAAFVAETGISQK